MLRKNKTLRILLWAPLGAGEHYWGPGTSAFRLYSLGLERFQSVTLVHASEKQGLYPNVFCEQVKLPGFEKLGRFGYINYFISAHKWINENYHKYDVFHGISTFEYTFRPALQFCRLGKPAFIKITGENYGINKHSLLSNLLGISRSRKKNANAITGYIAISKNIEANLLNYGIDRKNIYKIPNGVNEIKFSPRSKNDKLLLREKLKIENRKTILFVGGINERKRPYECIIAVNELIKTGCNIQFYLVGPDRSKNGKLLAELKKYVKNNNISDKIFFISETNHPELYYQASDIFLLPSKNEGMPNALLEAMACRNACIVTPVSGSVDLIDDGINGLYTNGDSGDISKKIRLLLNNNKLSEEFGNNARKSICDNYSSKMILKQHLDLFYSYNEI